MIRAGIALDLPSAEIARGRRPIDWIQSLFGQPVSLGSGREELTISAFSLVEGVWRALQRVGVHDAISFVVDDKVVYVDTHDVANDLDLVRAAARESGALDRPFREMHLVCTHREDGLHALFDLRVTSEVVLGDAEMEVEIAGRPEELRIAPGEAADAYAARIKRFSSDPGPIEAYRLWLDDLVRELATALEREIAGSRAAVDRAEVKVIRPGPAEIAGFGDLRFGAAVSPPQYRPRPEQGRAGAHPDPFASYWDDPYWELTNYLLLDAILRDAHWRSSHVRVVDSGGVELFRGSTAAASGAELAAVRITEAGVRAAGPAEPGG